MKEVVTFDGHCHLFDAIGDIMDGEYGSGETGCVGFIDVRPQYFDKRQKIDYFTLYTRFINKYRNKLDNVLLLASAETPSQMIQIYDEHKDIIKGFGECKLYNKCAGIPVNNKKLFDIDNLCYFMCERHIHLPVYIHYTLTRKTYIQELEKLLTNYPLVPIVLCHCGMEEDENRSIDDVLCNEYIYLELLKLQKKYDNLWFDVSYTALDFMYENDGYIDNLRSDRVILGKDANPFAQYNCKWTIYEKQVKFNALYPKVNNKENIYKLFNL